MSCSTCSTCWRCTASCVPDCRTTTMTAMSAARSTGSSAAAAGQAPGCGTIVHPGRRSRRWTGCSPARRRGGAIMTRSDLPAGQQLDLLDAVAAEPPQLTLDQLLHQLQQWVEVGWLRALDRALVVFLLDSQPDTHPLVLL